MCIVYTLWFVVNVHSTSYTRVYSYRINHCMLVFYHFACAMGYCDWSSDKGLCSEFVHVGCVDKVVDGPHGW